MMWGDPCGRPSVPAGTIDGLRLALVAAGALTAHVSAFAHISGHRCVLIDADPQGSLTLWHAMRPNGGVPLRNAAQGIERLLGSFAAGASAGEFNGDLACRIEIAGLWSAIERSVEAINGAHAASAGLRGEAA